MNLTIGGIDSLKLAIADAREVEAALATIDDAARALSATLLTLAKTRESIEGILRPREPDDGRAWQ